MTRHSFSILALAIVLGGATPLAVASRSLKVLKLISLAKHAKIAKNRFFSIRTGPQTEG